MLERMECCGEVMLGFVGQGGTPCEPLENDESHPLQVPTGSNSGGGG